MQILDETKDETTVWFQEMKRNIVLENTNNDYINIHSGILLIINY